MPILHTIKSLDDFCELVDNIQTYKHKGFVRPHKYILLLSTVNLIEKGCGNKFIFNNELVDEFQDACRNFSFNPNIILLEYPYFHLKSSLWWHHHIKIGKEEKYTSYIENKIRFTPNRIKETIEFSYFSDELFVFLSDPNSRRKAIGYLSKKILTISQESNLSSVDLTPRALKIPSKFPHEQQALQAIIPPLENQVQFVSNFELYVPGTNEYLECDLVAISSSCITIIELKHWGGEIEILPNNWQVNGQYRQDPHRVNNYKCKVLKSYLEKEFPYFDIPWVDSVVVLTNPDAIVHNESRPKKAQKNPTFAGTDALVQYLQYRISTEQAVLGTNDRKKIADQLWELTEGPKKKGLKIPGYEILENITQSSERLEFLARIQGLELQTIKRLRVFETDPSLPADEREKQRNRAQITLRALDQVSNHPNLIRVEPVSNDENLVIEVSGWSDDGTLADVIYRKESEGGKFSVDEAVKIIQGIVAGLTVLHEEAVVHRDLRPENILMDGAIPVLMNFDYTYIPDDHGSEYTVLPDSKTLNASPFLAPELYIDGQFSEATDLFSVGVIFYTLLCGKPPFASSMDLLDVQDGLTKENISYLQKVGANEAILALIKSLILFDRTDRPQEAADIEQEVQELLAEPKEKEKPKSTNEPLEPGETYNVYKIEKIIGTGREAQVYAAKGFNGREVALKLFFNKIPKDRIENEQRCLSWVDSPFVLHVYGFPQKWKNDRFFIETNLVHGTSLRELIKKGPLPTVDSFRHFASCLLMVLKELHRDSSREKPLLHNDIKPDNILVSANGDPVLIDFGAACTPHIGVYSGTNYYAAPDLLRKIDFDFCESGDLFALSVTLFEWLCGRRPYDGVPSVESIPHSVNDLREDEIPEPLIQWLEQAVQPQRGNRFENILTMQEAFESIGWDQKKKHEEKPPPQPVSVASVKKIPTEQPSPVAIAQDNVFVRYLNTLHNVTAVDDGALAESQALSEHFGQLQVPLQQTTYILQQLTKADGSHVLLTGHAGDGKSTIGLELYKKLSNCPPDSPLEQPLQKVETIKYNGINVHIVKDMSELSSADREETLQSALTGNDSERWFIISNTGTLLSTFKKIADKQGEHWFSLEADLLKALNHYDPKVLPFLGTPFAVINLAKTDNIKTGIAVFRRILEHSGLSCCDNCKATNFCAIHRNIQALRETKHISLTRIELAYRRLREYGLRLTMRQMTGHLAYSLTGGWDCAMIHEHAVSPVPPEPLDIFFSNRFFGYTGTGVDEQAKRMPAIQYLLDLNMGSKPFPALDRMLWSQESDELPVVPANLARIFQPLLESTQQKNDDFASLTIRETRMAIRRLYYVFCNEFPEVLSNFLPEFLDSQMLEQSEVWQAGKGPQTIFRNQLLRKILHVLQEEYSGFQLSETEQEHYLYITLRRCTEGYRQSVQLLLAEIPRSNFTLQWRSLNQEFKPIRYVLILVEKSSQSELRLDLPFLDFVLMRDMGEIGQRLNPGYKDRLERFKTQLLEYFEGENELLKLLEMNRDGTLQTRGLEIHDQQLQVIQ